MTTPSAAARVAALPSSGGDGSLASAVEGIMRRVSTLSADERSQLATLLRELEERCWMCSRAEFEPIRLARRGPNGRWRTIATIQLCDGCLTRLTTPALARSVLPQRSPAAPRAPAKLEGLQPVDPPAAPEPPLAESA